MKTSNDGLCCVTLSQSGLRQSLHINPRGSCEAFHTQKEHPLVWVVGCFSSLNSMSQQVSFIVAFASVFGAAEAIRQTQARARRQEHRSRKNNLVVHCIKSSRYSSSLEGKHVILSGNKVCSPSTGFVAPWSAPPRPAVDPDIICSSISTRGQSMTFLSAIALLDIFSLFQTLSMMVLSPR